MNKLNIDPDLVIEDKHQHAEVRQDQKLARSVWIRGLCICLAWVCIGLGILGIFIPGLPTVDFLILATFFAAKGSTHLYQWLLSNRVIGLLIREWQTHRKIPKKIKYLSTFSISIAALMILWGIPYPWFAYPVIVCMFAVIVWLWWKG